MSKDQAAAVDDGCFTRMTELRADIVEMLDQLIAEHLDAHVREENPIGIGLALAEIQQLAERHAAAGNQP